MLSSKIAHGARSGRSTTRKTTTITMELYGIPPPTIDWSGSHLPEAWKNLKQHLNLFFRRSSERKDGRGKSLKTPAVGVGDKGRDIYNTFSAEEKRRLKPHWDKFQIHVQPKLNQILSRYKFSNEVQGSSTFNQFVTQLKLYRDCNFKDTDKMIRIVFGIQSEKIGEKIINIGEELTLDKAIQ